MEIEERAVAIADRVVPAYRAAGARYSCTGHVAKMWNAAYDGALSMMQELQAGAGWDHRYRPLETGEIIRSTDECRRDDGTWATGICVGTPAPDPAYTSHRVYRRLKDAA